MKNKHLVSTLVLGLIGLSVHSQTLSPTVISSSGEYYSAGTASLSFTVAEMTMVQTYNSTGNILTQGFQQPEDYPVGITETPQAPGSIHIYPNPSSGSFALSYYNSGNSENTIKLYNLVGQVVLTKGISPVIGQNTVNFDIRSFNQGIYILELTTVNVKGEKITENHIINIVY